MCKLLTFPVSISDGENGVVAVIDSNEVAAIRRRCRIYVVLENARTVLVVAEGEMALRPYNDHVVSGHVDCPVEHVGGKMDRDVRAEDPDVGGRRTSSAR